MVPMSTPPNAEVETSCAASGFIFKINVIQNVFSVEYGLSCHKENIYRTSP